MYSQSRGSGKDIWEEEGQDLNSGESPRGGGSRERNVSSRLEKSRLRQEEHRDWGSEAEKASKFLLESESFSLLYFKSIYSTGIICWCQARY